MIEQSRLKDSQFPPLDAETRSFLHRVKVRLLNHLGRAAQLPRLPESDHDGICYAQDDLRRSMNEMLQAGELFLCSPDAGRRLCSLPNCRDLGPLLGAELVLIKLTDQQLVDLPEEQFKQVWEVVLNSCDEPRAGDKPQIVRLHEFLTCSSLQEVPPSDGWMIDRLVRGC